MGVNIKSVSPLLGKLLSRPPSWLDATLAALGDGFIRTWTVVERSYRRPLSHFAFLLKFAFYPLPALAALAKSGFSNLFRVLHTPPECADVVAAEVEVQVAVAVADQ